MRALLIMKSARIELASTVIAERLEAEKSPASKFVARRFPTLRFVVLNVFAVRELVANRPVLI